MSTAPTAPQRPNMLEPECNFCSAPYPTWRWSCKSFRMPEHMWGSTADWAACDTCNDLILHNKWTDLAVRGARNSPGFSDLPPSHMVVVVRAVKALHEKFVANRTSLTPTSIVRTPTNEGNSNAAD